MGCESDCESDGGEDALVTSWNILGGSSYHVYRF